ncbi:hypothetical protein HPB47_007946, partial [Ixodes persulcatus]
SRKLHKFLILLDNESLLYFPGSFLSGRVLVELEEEIPVSDAGTATSFQALGDGAWCTAPKVEGDPDGRHWTSTDICVLLDTIGPAGALRTVSAYKPPDANKTPFFASWYGMFSWTFRGGRAAGGARGVKPCSLLDAGTATSFQALGDGAWCTAPKVEGGPDGRRWTSTDIFVPLDTIGPAGPLRTVSAYEPLDANKTPFFASWENYIDFRMRLLGESTPK